MSKSIGKSAVDWGGQKSGIVYGCQEDRKRRVKYVAVVVETWQTPEYLFLLVL